MRQQWAALFILMLLCGLPAQADDAQAGADVNAVSAAQADSHGEQVRPTAEGGDESAQGVMDDVAKLLGEH